MFALRHPSAVQALLLWRVTGGPFAAQRLADYYSRHYIHAVQRGGMSALCETEHCHGRIQARGPSWQDRRVEALEFDASVKAVKRQRWGGVVVGRGHRQ